MMKDNCAERTGRQSEITVRRAEIGDAREISRLNVDGLGYEFGEEETRAVLARILGDGNSVILVAELDGEFAGYVHLCAYETTFSPPASNVMGLAVCTKFRRQGVGRALLRAAEDWARASGHETVRLCSGMERTEAHEFYAQCGYARVKEQLQFRKRL